MPSNRETLDPPDRLLYRVLHISDIIGSTKCRGEIHHTWSHSHTSSQKVERVFCVLRTTNEGNAVTLS